MVSKLLAGSVLLVMLLTGLAILQAERLAAVKSQRDELRASARIKADEVEMLRNEKGELVARVEAFHASRQTLQELRDEGYYDFLKQFTDIRKDLRNLQHATSVSSVIRDSLTIRIRDSTISNVGARVFAYRDSFAHIFGEVGLDSLRINYQIQAPIAVAVTWKRRWFLGKKRFYAQATSPNPKIKITNLENITIKKHENR